MTEFFLLTCIILNIVGFIFVQKETTEYLAWIMLFLLYFLMPFSWIKDIQILPKQPFFLYSMGALLITYILTFSSLITILIKNEDIRKKKKTATLKTRIPEIEKPGKDIWIIFTTINVLTWGIVLLEFIGHAPPPDTLHAKVHAIFFWIKEFLGQTDEMIHAYASELPLPALLKSFFVYCCTFLLAFFGLFIRIPPHQPHLFKRLKFVNMTPLFTGYFEKHFTSIQNLIVFLVSSVSCASFGQLLSFFFDSQVVYSCVSIAALIFFSVFYSFKQEIFKVTSVKNIIYLIICLLFGFLGAFPLCAMIELCASLEIGQLKLIFGSLSMGLAFSMFFSGLALNWISSENATPMKIILSVLVSMAIALFFALSTEYPMFQGLFGVLSFLVGAVLKFVAPIILVILSSILLYLSYKTLKAVKRTKEL